MLFKGGVASEPGQEKRGILYDFPLADKPIICKLLYNPNKPADACLSIDYFRHPVGNNESDVRFHPSLESLGQGKSPEREHYWRLVNQLSALKKEGQNNSEEFKSIMEEKQRFESRRGGYLFFVEPNSADVRALKIGPMVFNRLFGKKKTEHRPEVVSIQEEMREEGLTPWLSGNLDENKTGWIRIYKTGQKLATEYHMEVCVTKEVQTVNGKKVTMTVPTEFDLHETILSWIADESKIDFSRIPNPLDVEKKNAWTYDESQAFVDSAGTLAGVPERFLKNNTQASGSERVTSTSYAARGQAEYVPAEGEEEIAF